MKWRRTVARACGLTVLLVAGLTVLSYRVEALRPLREWSEPAMAINTALCFVLLALALGLGRD